MLFRLIAELVSLSSSRLVLLCALVQLFCHENLLSHFVVMALLHPATLYQLTVLLFICYLEIALFHSVDLTDC